MTKVAKKYFYVVYYNRDTNKITPIAKLSTTIDLNVKWENKYEELLLKYKQ